MKPWLFGVGGKKNVKSIVVAASLPYAEYSSTDDGVARFGDTLYSVIKVSAGEFLLGHVGIRRSSSVTGFLSSRDFRRDRSGVRVLSRDAAPGVPRVVRSRRPSPTTRRPRRHEGVVGSLLRRCPRVSQGIFRSKDQFHDLSVIYVSAKIYCVSTKCRFRHIHSGNHVHYSRLINLFYRREFKFFFTVHFFFLKIFSFDDIVFTSTDCHDYDHHTRDHWKSTFFPRLLL